MEQLDHDGHQLAVHRYPAETGSAIVMLPAMGVPARYYKRFAPQLVDAGFDVTIADLRGTGASAPLPSRGVDYGYAELIGDLDVLLEHLAPRLEGKRVSLLGHSLGGHIATLYLAALHRRSTPPPVDVEALMLVASGIPHHRHYGLVGPFLYGYAAMTVGLSTLVGHWPGRTFGGRQSHGIMRDWAHTVRTGSFVDIGADSATDLATVDVPILAVTVDNDSFTPPSTARHLTDRLTAAAVTTFHYGKDQTDAPLDHFKWAQDGQTIANRIADFLKRD